MKKASLLLAVRPGAPSSDALAPSSFFVLFCCFVCFRDGLGLGLGACMKCALAACVSIHLVHIARWRLGIMPRLNV